MKITPQRKQKAINKTVSLSCTEKVNKQKRPETRGELDFQNKTGSSREKE